MAGKAQKIILTSPLIEAVKAQRCVLFLGAGASKEARNSAGQTPPDANQLRDILAERFFQKAMPNRDVMAVAEMAIVSGFEPACANELQPRTARNARDRSFFIMRPPWQLKVDHTRSWTNLVLWSDFLGRCGRSTHTFDRSVRRQRRPQPLPRRA